MASVYVLGQRQQVTGFIGVGAKAVEVNDTASALQELSKLASDDDAALILVYESLILDAPAEFEAIREICRGSILVIPDHLGSRGLMLEIIRQSVEKSIGVDLIGKEKQPV